MMHAVPVRAKIPTIGARRGRPPCPAEGRPPSRQPGPRGRSRSTSAEMITKGLRQRTMVSGTGGADAHKVHRVLRLLTHADTSTDEPARHLTNSRVQVKVSAGYPTGRPKHLM